MNARLLSHRLPIERAEKVSRTPAGMLLPDTAHATGRGKRLDDGNGAGLRVALGDRVPLPTNPGDEIRIASDPHLIIPEDTSWRASDGRNR